MQTESLDQLCLIGHTGHTSLGDPSRFRLVSHSTAVTPCPLLYPPPYIRVGTATDPALQRGRAGDQSVTFSSISVTSAAMGERSDRVNVTCAKSG